MSKLNILVAIPYCDRQTLDFIAKLPDCRFLLDSGAFTAWKAGNEMTLRDYCQFLDRMPFQPWRYFTLDKIGNAEGTRANFEQLLKGGHKPIPIFTRGENVDMLDYYYDHSDVVAIGGLVGTRGNKGFVKGIMEKIGQRQTHWLGFTQNDFLNHYKPFSADSSSWAGAVRYGRINLYLGRGRWMPVGKKDFLTMPSSAILKAFEEYGEDPARMARKEEWINSGKGDALLEVMTCKSWTRFQIEVEELLGVKYFLACACFWQVRQMAEAHAFWIQKRKSIL